MRTPLTRIAPLVAVAVLIACSDSHLSAPLEPADTEPITATLAGSGVIDRVELHDCRVFRQFYVTSREAVEAVLPEGYTPLTEADGSVVVLTDITECAGFTYGQRRGSGGAIHHEVIRAFGPDGLLSGGFGFPATFTNPHLREAFRAIGIPGRPAMKLDIAFEAGVGGSTVVDNVKAFGPDYSRSFEAVFPGLPVSGTFVQHHEYENGEIRKMSWSFPTPHAMMGGPATPLEFTGEFTFPVLGEFPVVGGVTLAFGTPEPADWVVMSVE